jgi:hypothetical protein
MTHGSNNRVLTATGTDSYERRSEHDMLHGTTGAVTGAITATGDITAFLYFR